MIVCIPLIFQTRQHKAGLPFHYRWALLYDAVSKGSPRSCHSYALGGSELKIEAGGIGAPEELTATGPECPGGPGGPGGGNITMDPGGSTGPTEGGASSRRMWWL